MPEGLAAAVLSKDAARCERVVNAFDCGIVWVNNTQLSHISAPWGGVKARLCCSLSTLDVDLKACQWIVDLSFQCFVAELWLWS